ncbi:family 1 glycosylhydrolase [Streptomyces sp. NPDC051909]|uniref:family 1 glycosylhydrolase n=1 Tax=Streptomyces sp. NPDC051909 TaxID=3154944 RepID=UPI00342CD4C2
MGSASQPAVRRWPFRDPALPWNQRVDHLTQRLTLDERIALRHDQRHGGAWLGGATVCPQAVGLRPRLRPAHPTGLAAPAVTPYHGDLPQSLATPSHGGSAGGGGRRVRETVEAFAQYAALAAERYGDRVERWITLDEPYCSAFVGGAEGLHAPGAHPGDRATWTGLLLAGGHPSHEADTWAGLAAGPWQLPGDLELLRDLHSRYPRPHQSGSPRTAQPRTTPSPPTIRSTSRTGSPTWPTTSPPSRMPSRPGWSTPTRTPEDSHHWHRGLITAHRARTEEATR